MAIDWTKEWSSADTGTIIGGNHLGTLQDDIDAGFEQALSDALSVALPSQTGHANNLLTTDGSNASWVALLDEDDMATDSATRAASQQSIKAYVDGAAKFTDRGDPAAYDFTVGSFTVDNAWGHYLDLSGIIPAGTTAVVLRISCTNSAANENIGFRKKGNSNAVNVAYARVMVAGISNDDDLVITVSSDRMIEYKCNNGGTWTGINVVVAGWWK
jgi:hypothetical protein